MMEIWILIAAAGSGYLAQYWQSSRKPEETPIDIADDEGDDRPGSSSHTRPLKRRYYSLSSRRRRMKGLFNKNWNVSKFNQGVGKMTGCVHNHYVPVGDDKETQPWHNWAVPDICDCSNMPTQFETRFDATCSHSTYAVRSSHIPNTFNGFWPQKCCGFSQGNHDGSGLLSSEKVPSMLPEAFLDGRGCCMSSLYFAHCAENSAMDKSGFMLPEGSPTKCIYEVFDNNMINGEGQDHEGGSSSSTRKVRPHQSNGRSRSSTKRRRSRVICRSLMSSGSCLSVQSVDSCSQEVAEIHTHNSLACELPFRGLEQNKDEYNTKASGSCGKEVPRRECPVFFGGDDSEWQGSGNNLLKLLLFNFGVGIGMMFLIMSNKHCTNQVFKPLEEALCLLKDLEGEVQCRKKLRFQFYNTRRDGCANVLAGQGHDAIKSLRRIIELVEQVRVSSSKDPTSEHHDSSLTMELATGRCTKTANSADYRLSKETARLEAELEAELEKMEINLSIGDVSVLCPRYSGEDDLEIGELVQGELSTRGMPCDVEADSDDSDSSYGAIHFGNCAVPPLELAKRLHEVLEARQEEKILELEAELKKLDSRLQAKENEFQVWKQRAWHLLQDSAFESGSGFEKKGDCMKAADTTKKVLFSSTQERKHSFCGPQPRTCLGDEAYDEVCEEFFQLWSDTATETPSCSHNRLLKGPHLECEHVSCTNDVASDTLVNTPCTLQAMDKHTVAHHHLGDKLKHKAEMEASSTKNHSYLECKGRLNLDEDGEVLLHLDNIPFSQICAQDVIDIFESHGQFGRILDRSMSEDSSYSSELDEQFGQLLIKRIVEKSKRDSSIVELAQSVVASLEIDETDMET